MLIQVAKFTWEFTTDSPERIPELVELVARKGGHFLIFKNEYISVVRAMEHKALFEKYLNNAMSHLSKYYTAKWEDSFIHKRNAISDIKSSGAYFRYYCDVLNVGDPNRIQLEPPTSINALHKFKKYFGRCVYDPQTRASSYQL